MQVPCEQTFRTAFSKLAEAANLLSAVLNMQTPCEQTFRTAFDNLAEAAKLLSAVLSMQTPCEKTFRTACYNLAEAASFCQQCKHLAASPSGRLAAFLQKRFHPDKRGGIGQAILTRTCISMQL